MNNEGQKTTIGSYWATSSPYPLYKVVDTKTEQDSELVELVQYGTGEPL